MRSWEDKMNSSVPGLFWPAVSGLLAPSLRLLFPAPAYFKRVAIILRKKKDYSREIGIIELYWQLCDRVYEAKRRDGARAQLMAHHSALKAGFQKRYEKAKLLLEKQKRKA